MVSDTLRHRRHLVRRGDSAHSRSSTGTMTRLLNELGRTLDDDPAFRDISSKSPVRDGGRHSPAQPAHSGSSASSGWMNNLLIDPHEGESGTLHSPTSSKRKEAESSRQWAGSPSKRPRPSTSKEPPGQVAHGNAAGSVAAHQAGPADVATSSVAPSGRPPWQFQPGHKPWNAGKSYTMGPQATWNSYEKNAKEKPRASRNGKGSKSKRSRSKKSR